MKKSKKTSKVNMTEVPAVNISWLKESHKLVERDFRKTVEKLNYHMSPNGGGLENIHLPEVVRSLDLLLVQYLSLRYAIGEIHRRSDGRAVTVK